MYNIVIKASRLLLKSALSLHSIVHHPGIGPLLDYKLHYKTRQVLTGAAVNE